MPELTSIPPSQLLIDNLNPRLQTPSQSQKDALREMAKHQGKKMAALAKDIVENGLNPSDLLIVMPNNDDQKRFFVLEGNRRLRTPLPQQLRS